jgi:NAD(P)H-hydrate epimerase
MIVTPAEMGAIEQAVFARGGTAEALMDAVGRSLAARLYALTGGRHATVVFYAGKGNNAGDVLAAANVLRRLSAELGGKLQVVLRLAFANPDHLGDLPRKKLATLNAPDPGLLTLQATGALPLVPGKLLVVDGLLGIGATGALREPIRGAAREINALRASHGAYVLAMDLPSGVDAASGATDPDAVIADETVTVGFVKAGLVADEAVNHVGKLTVIDLPAFREVVDSAAPRAAADTVTTPAVLGALRPPRPHESNKGMYGRIGILAGSVGATGAAVMCSHACARAGGGLITLLTHPDIYPIVAGAASPEVMVKPLPHLLDALDMNFDVLGLGPGLGREHGSEVRALVARWPKPMVVDADGLNALAEDMQSLDRPAGPRLLTPHPGEMQRLLKGSPELRTLAANKGVPRARLAHEFTARYPVTLLLKGARTIIGESGRPLAYNSTGNAGMATGGMGDVLTGICCALAGQKLCLYDAARYGAWVHGQAADLAREHGESAQSLLPGDVIAFLGRAFDSVAQSAAA